MSAMQIDPSLVTRLFEDELGKRVKSPVRRWIAGEVERFNTEAQPDWDYAVFECSFGRPGMRRVVLKRVSCRTGAYLVARVSSHDQDEVATVIAPSCPFCGFALDAVTADDRCPCCGARVVAA